MPTIKQRLEVLEAKSTKIENNTPDILDEFYGLPPSPAWRDPKRPWTLEEFYNQRKEHDNT